MFRNHRHWDDDDGTGFPYEHCAALSLGGTCRETEWEALSLCGGQENQCKIREWVCT